MFDFVKNSSLTSSDFQLKIEFLIDDLIAKNLITMIYAAGGSGKSWLAYAIADITASNGMDVIYLDYDNPISVLGEREIEKKLINKHRNLFYISSFKVDLKPIEMIDQIIRSGTQSRLDNTLIFLDSLRDFVDVRNDNQAMYFMEKLKQLRNLGATVIALSHANKDGNNYEGSNNIYNSLDNLFHLKKIAEEKGKQLKYLITPRKDRASAGETAWALDTINLELTELDINEAKLSNEDKTFINKTISVIRQTPGLNQKQLLETLGTNKKDKTACARLERYDGKHWVRAKKSNIYTYELKQES